MTIFYEPHPSHRLSVAPMMDVTDTCFRRMIRILSRKTLLYTEMIVDNTIVHASKDGRLPKILAYHESEHPLIAQLGGSQPKQLAFAARVLEDYGYDGINLNVGCPSDRVQTGAFGACLMKDANLVADCLKSMQAAVKIPVSIKHRIGVDEFEGKEFLHDFVGKLASAGVRNFIVHARKAWLKGLSPAQNRKIPKLNHQAVYELKAAFPHLIIETNGEIKSLAEAKTHLLQVDGAMIGRAAADDPWLFSQADSMIFGLEDPFRSRTDMLLALDEECQRIVSEGGRSVQMLRHCLGLFHSVPRAKLWRRFVTETMHKEPQATDILKRSLKLFCDSEDESAVPGLSG